MTCNAFKDRTKCIITRGSRLCKNFTYLKQTAGIKDTNIGLTRKKDELTKK
jgi:hypothetical protein